VFFALLNRKSTKCNNWRRHYCS